ncbi:MAG: hypothetical protein AAGE84_17120 [Cyanobacteria bacterium P01_G01_bin.39]
MKIIPLDCSVSNQTECRLRETYTNKELTSLVETFLRDTAEMSNPKTQEKILAEARSTMQKLKNLNK